MSGNSQYSLAARNAGVTARAALLNGGKLRLYDGAQPATADVAVTTQNLLAEITPLPNPAFGAASAGAVALNPVTVTPPATAAGKCTWARALESDGATVVADFAVIGSGLITISANANPTDTVIAVNALAFRVAAGAVLTTAAGKPVTVTAAAAAGAITIAVAALAQAITAGDTINYGVIEVDTGGALAGATAVPVKALAMPVYAGFVANFGNGKSATITADAAAGATSLTCSALPAALVAGDLASGNLVMNNANIQLNAAVGISALTLTDAAAGT